MRRKCFVVNHRATIDFHADLFMMRLEDYCLLPHQVHMDWVKFLISVF